MSDEKLLWGDPTRGFNPAEFTGGARYGKDYYDSINATWPLAKLVINPDLIVISTLWKSFSLPRNQIKRVVKYSGFMGEGIRFEHTLKEYPPFIVFWTRSLDEVAAKLAENGFVLNEDLPK